jgi:glucan phosphoethanolaminetransferase (alkaline phosphatase superfamily)
MTATWNQQPAHSLAYVCLVVVPLSVLAWTIVIVSVRPKISESTLYLMIDSILYLATVGALVLVAIPLLYLRSPSFKKLTILSIICAFALAFLTFVGYMVNFS